VSARQIAFRGEFSAPTHAAISTPFAQVGPTIGRLVRGLLARKRPDGSWCEPAPGGAATIAEVLALFAFLAHDSPRQPRLIESLIERQLPDGGWANTPGGASDFDTTVRCYLALKVCGTDGAALEPARQRLAAWGSGSCEPMTRLMLALFGQLPHADDWLGLPTHSLPEEWALEVINARRPVRPTPRDTVLVHLFRDEIHWPTGRNWNPLRLWNARRAGQELQQFFATEGAVDVGGPTSILSLVALSSLGAGEAAMRGAWRALDERIIDGDVIAALSPVHDTASALVALCETGMAAEAGPVAAAGEWLWARLVAGQSRGDLNVRDAALTLVALAKSGFAFRGDRPTLIDHVLHSIFDEQADDGGWGSVESAGLVLEALGHFGIHADEPVVIDAIQFLEAAQQDGGDLKETWRVLAGLRAVAHDPHSPMVRRAADWIKRSQNAGGGWADGANEPAAPPTAQALRALMAAADANSPDVDAGVDWLLGVPSDNSEAIVLSIAALAQFERHSAGWARTR
jgi:squalene-hopene/tetraprenyl-beta-curcumene cyclase